MHLYVHKERHIVVSATEKPEQGELLVSWVALASNVEGAKKRGRRPDYKKKVPVADLAPLADSDVSEDVRSLAETVLSKAASTDAAAE